MSRILAFDFSQSKVRPQDPNDIGYPNLMRLKEEGVGLVIWRMISPQLKEDTYFERYYQDALSCGMPFAGYAYINPWKSLDEHVRMIEHVAEGRGLKFIALDVEDWWGNTQAPYPDYIYVRVRSVYAWLQANSYKPVIYTRASFVWQYCRPLITWFSEYNIPVWWAQYAFHGKGFNPTWDAYRQWSVYNQTRLGNPSFFRGWPGKKDWVGWQWCADRIKLPGAGRGNVDMNWFDRKVLE